MKRAILAMVTVSVLLSFLAASKAIAVSCPDYGLVCNDNTCHGWYGTCWSWKHMMCLPCEDHGNVCGTAGSNCIWFKSGFDDVVINILCKYVHLDHCVVCTNLPCRFDMP